LEAKMGQTPGLSKADPSCQHLKVQDLLIPIVN
jgi:hypothetical protein